ncbi:hypothetical protein ACRRTK_001610 [Alexandromys fortis]
MFDKFILNVKNIYSNFVPKCQYASLFVLELTMHTSLSCPQTQRFTCLFLCSAGNKDVHHLPCLALNAYSQ